MAHEKALKEAKKALDVGYSEDDAKKLLKARGLDKDEIEKELPPIKAKKVVEEHEALKRAAHEAKSAPASQSQSLAAPRKSYGFWFIVFLLVLAGAGVWLYYMGLLKF